MSGSKTVKRKSREREQEILSATLKVLRHHGVSATTTALVAAEAHCSKETIYNWFGDQAGLYRSLVETHGNLFVDTMSRLIAQEPDIERQLELFCSLLLDLVTGEAGIIINQLVDNGNSEQVTQLHKALNTRHLNVTRIGKDLLSHAQNKGLIRFADLDDAFSTLFGLALGVHAANAHWASDISRPSGAEMEAHSKGAIDKFLQIYSVRDQV